MFAVRISRRNGLSRRLSFIIPVLAIAGVCWILFNTIKDNYETTARSILNDAVQPPASSGSRDESFKRRQKDSQNRYRSNFVRSMMKFAWDKYSEFAWGDNELHPISRTGAGGAGLGDAKLGATILDSLDTLKLMKLDQDFLEATKWIESEFNFANKSTQVSVFETNIRALGGLLSAHALSANRAFMEKAIVVADFLLSAFENSVTGLPHSLLWLPPNSRGSLYTWFPDQCVSLADVGTLDIEFMYLSAITGNQIYLAKADAVRQFIKKTRSPNGLYPNIISFTNPNGTRCPASPRTSVGAFGDSYYEYLFKSWLLSSKTDTEAKILFDESLEALEKHLLQKSANGYTYFAKYHEGGGLDHNMEHLACFIGGLYALSAGYSTKREQRMELAREVTRTCHASYHLTRTRIGPEAFVFDEKGNPVPAADSKQYALRPEVVESYFYMWKTTGNETYREWAWEAAQAIEKHCRKPAGYSGIADVDNLLSPGDDVQQSYFMAETLKYLYLTFLDEDVLPLDTWVYNTEAHPLPVIGSLPFRKAFEAWRGVPFSSEHLPHRGSA